ncbi:MAG: UvrD-helicase domain-containing protein, partial [Candidatus Omnitrophica bacterium]|nr:UvrD-helicase domain-containing protein [Candidatus Omnitrophota bacterium]
MYSLFNCYIDIFNETLNEFRGLSRAQDALFLEQLNKEAHRLFGKDKITVPELYYRLSLRLRHFLIDEFQDTSVLQWLNICGMVEEAVSSGGTLFYVGDKKQAIFRFHGGEVSLFDAVRENFKNYKIDSSTLNINYRSQKQIVDFNNRVFSEDNLSKFLHDFIATKKDNHFLGPADIQDIIRVFGDARQSYRKENQEGFVKAEFIDADDAENYAELIKPKLIKLVEELKVRFGYENIAILTRKNEDVALLTEWLLEYNIPVESEKTLNIRENPLIKEFISLLKFLNSPIDNLSFASFIMGEIFLRASGLKREVVEGFLFEINLLSKERDIGYFYKEFRSKFPAIWQALLEDLFRSVGIVPLYELAQGACEKLEVFKNFPDSHGFFMRLWELVKENAKEHSTISAFLEYFDRAPQEHLYVNVTKSSAVKILTIHKAKGLGFGAVIIPFLEMEIKVGGAGNNLGQGYLVYEDKAKDENKIRLLRLKSKYTRFSPAAKNIYACEY